MCGPSVASALRASVTPSTARQLQQYALLVLCARRHGLVANVTSAVHVGAIPDELLRRQEACARVDAAFLAATQPDNTTGDVFAVGAATYAAKVMWQ